MSTTNQASAKTGWVLRPDPDPEHWLDLTEFMDADDPTPYRLEDRFTDAELAASLFPKVVDDPLRLAVAVAGLMEVETDDLFVVSWCRRTDDGWEVLADGPVSLALGPNSASVGLLSSAVGYRCTTRYPKAPAAAVDAAGAALSAYCDVWDATPAGSVLVGAEGEAAELLGNLGARACPGLVIALVAEPLVGTTPGWDRDVFESVVVPNRPVLPLLGRVS